MIAEWPTAPPPPVLFVTLMVCLRVFSASLHRARRMVSVPPPGAQGQMTVTGFRGKAWAATGANATRASTTATSARPARFHAVLFIRSSISYC